MGHGSDDLAVEHRLVVDELLAVGQDDVDGILDAVQGVALLHLLLGEQHRVVLLFVFADALMHPDILHVATVLLLEVGVAAVDLLDALHRLVHEADVLLRLCHAAHLEAALGEMLLDEL